VKRSRGQSLVEFAITLPVFFALVFGVIDGGRLAYTLVTLDSAVQDGARYAALASTASTAAVQNKVVDSAYLLNVSASAVTVQVNNGATTYTARTSGDRVTLTTTYNYQPIITSVFGLGFSVSLNSRSDVMVE
jgi:Flp pilus assembly protein TadG